MSRPFCSSVVVRVARSLASSPPAKRVGNAVLGPHARRPPELRRARSDVNGLSRVRKSSDPLETTLERPAVTTLQREHQRGERAVRASGIGIDNESNATTESLARRARKELAHGDVEIVREIVGASAGAVARRGANRAVGDVRRMHDRERRAPVRR